jgi:Ser/Thr protein kinase RdoA (MazF antagonist)
MSNEPLDLAARRVLQRYPAIAADATLRKLTGHGGFSGAVLWQVIQATRMAVLKAWPPGEGDADRLTWIHGLMRAARQAGLDFVPAVHSDREGRTVFQDGGRLWDLSDWHQGEGFDVAPSAARARNACTALARIHEVWCKRQTPVGPCPAVQRRLARTAECARLVSSGWQPDTSLIADPVVQTCATPAWRLSARWLERVPEALAPWTTQRLPLQPCLCDIWHDHVLFAGDKVTGMIDYGSARIDHVAVDLARLLGSTVADDVTLRTAGLEAYCRVRPLSPAEQQLVTVLDWTGTVIALANWLLWLFQDRRPFPDYRSVARRMEKLIQRVEAWPL